MILVSLGLIFMNWRMRKQKIEHSRTIEQLEKTVVDLAEKQSVLIEKNQLTSRFKSSCDSKFAKLNNEIYGLFDLMMKIASSKEKGKD
jgi:hypothetical protein